MQFRIGLGSVVAALVSWVTWHSFWWMLLHFLLGWLYLIYYLARYVIFAH